MKKIVTLALLLVLGVTASNAQETSKVAKKIKAKTIAVSTPKVNGAGMVFVTETIDYGTVAYNSDGRREFIFTNNGNKPLIITNVQSTCGCTVPT